MRVWAELHTGLYYNNFSLSQLGHEGGDVTSPEWGEAVHSA